MSPDEAVKHLRVLTEDCGEMDALPKLRMVVREVKNILDKVQDRPTPVVRGIPSSPSNPLRRNRP